MEQHGTWTLTVVHGIEYPPLPELGCLHSRWGECRTPYPESRCACGAHELHWEHVPAELRPAAVKG